MGKHKTQAEREIALRVGARIRQLREIQRISQIQLATDIGIRAGPLGWIEKGKHLPSGRVLYRIAKQLNVRIDDLFQEKNVWEEGAAAAQESSPVLLPPLDNGTGPTAEPVKAAHIICQAVADAVLKLETLSGAARRPDFPLCVAFTPNEAGAEHLAAWVRQGLGIGNAVTGDTLDLFEAAGLRVVFLDMPEGCTTFSGYDPLNRNAFIFVNSQLKKQPELQTARVVFELGRVFWYTRKRCATGAEEAPANGEEAEALDEAGFARCFVAHFLMPSVAVRKTAWQLGVTPKTWTLDLLLRAKKRYGVCAQCFAQRLQSLGLSWSEKQKRNPRTYLFKDELDAFHAEHGAAAEPGGNRLPLAMNGRLGDLLLLAELKAGKDQKPVAAVKRVLRQSGVRLDA
jgi:transcriptional regulator with XRE-family HTH domain/Zn-dependent peptidase ImmA (M78 family)